MATPTQYTAEQIDTGLMAVIAWAGNVTAANRSLKAEGKLNVSYPTLNGWVKSAHADQV